MSIRISHNSIPKRSLYRRRSLAFIASAMLVLIFSPLGDCQTTWAVEGSVPLYGEFNSPPPGSLVGPVPYAVFPAPPPILPLPGNLPFPVMAPNFGGSAMDNDGNVYSGGPLVPAMIHSDGFTVEMSDPATGAFLISMAVGGGPFLPGPICGLAYDSPADIVWVTDGVNCIGLGLPPAPGVPPPIMAPMFPLPLVGGALASGLGWDPFTGTLWFCDINGLVTNCPIGGPPLITFPAAGPLAPPLMGLTVNLTNGNIQVTDGIMVAEFLPGGGLAGPGPFYLSMNPYPIPLWAAPISGLGFSLRPQRYGKGYTVTGAPPPTVNFGGGYPYVGSTTFTISQTGATPNASVYLMYNFFPAIPGLPLGGFPGSSLWIMPTATFGMVYLGLVPATGTVTLPIVLTGAPPGVPIFIQFTNIVSSGPTVIEMSDALSFTIGLP